MNTLKSPQLKIKALSLGLENALIHREETRIKQQIKRCKAKIDELYKSGKDPEKLSACRLTLIHLRMNRDSLRDHRKQVVRPIARDSSLAYGFLRGRAYQEMERKRFSDPDWAAIEKMVLKYGARAGSSQDLKQSFERFKQQAPDVQKCVDSRAVSA